MSDGRLGFDERQPGYYGALDGATSSLTSTDVGSICAFGYRVEIGRVDDLAAHGRFFKNGCLGGLGHAASGLGGTSSSLKAWIGTGGC